MKDGGPAFPQFTGLHSEQDAMGMSLRDWFAGQALRGIARTYGRDQAYGLSKDSYAIADAMLRERENDGPS